MRFITVLTGLLLAATVYGQSIVTPVFVHKDGDASASGYAGSEKEIFIDGGSHQSVGWITFQTEGIDVSKIASAKLVLYVNALTSPGTLQARLLTADITAPENNVRLTSIPADVAIAVSQALGTADVEKAVQLDLTAAVKAGTFRGVALTSDDGLAVTFDSKEGCLAPVIMLTNNVDFVAAKWSSGTIGPEASLGKDGDYYLRTVSGDVYTKASGAWAVVTNIVGATGPKGDQGTTGEKGDKGDAGINGTNGVDGAKGDKGDPGAAGPQGLKGDKGDAGINGTNGVDGAKGDKGDPGAAGPQGLKGDRGDAGINGINGRDGAKGDKGDKGDTGPQGSFPSGTATGDMQYWNGSAWVMIPAGQPGQALTLTGSKTPQWAQIPGTVTDIDGNVYRTIVIGSQEWTLTNLKTTKLNDGTAIPAGPQPASTSFTNAEWGALTTPGYCWPGDDVANKEKYGALYNWYAVNTGTLAPLGWRVPTDSDWTALENYLIANGFNYDGTTTGNKIAKSMAATVWTASTNTGAIGNNLSTNNKSSFSALSNGIRTYTGNFTSQGAYCYWWSATEYDALDAYHRRLQYDYNYLVGEDGRKCCGFSVRLVRNLN